MADEAYQDPKANKKELMKVYDVLKAAAEAKHGSKNHSNDALAEATIDQLVSAKDEKGIETFLTEKVRNSTGGIEASYAEIVKDKWGACSIDASIDNMPFHLQQCR